MASSDNHFRVILSFTVLTLSSAKLVDISPYFSSIVIAHNEYRREVGAADMRALMWDESLARQAEHWSRYCRYERTQQYTNRGQNLYSTKGFVGSWHSVDRTIRQALKSWHWEKQYFRYGSDCGSACSYVQMVRAQTDRIGCGMNMCNVLKVRRFKRKQTLFVCFYAPKGNLASAYPYALGKACANCPHGYRCFGGLCVPGGRTDSRRPAEIIDAESPREREPTPEKPTEPKPERPTEPKPERPTEPKPEIGWDKLTEAEVTQLMTVTNNMRDRKQRVSLEWSSYLESWAKHVIRCDIEYPGPSTAYTNFGKISQGTAVYELVYEWGDEGDDVYQKLSTGCRTPRDYKKCNHNTIMMEPALRRMACAACNCGRTRQLTCIYDARP